ncbi:hypothetical protein AO203_08215 [Lactobacillus gallinarum]|nr:hypothetical protein AO203_08215 [Lactobacillus gallinarum]
MVEAFLSQREFGGYDWEHRKPRLKRNRDYWIKKIEYNMKHYEQMNTDLEKKVGPYFVSGQNLHLKILIITLKSFYGI